MCINNGFKVRKDGLLENTNFESFPCQTKEDTCEYSSLETKKVRTRVVESLVNQKPAWLHDQPDHWCGKGLVGWSLVPVAELRDFVSKLVSRFETKRYTLSLFKTKKGTTSLI